MTTDDTALVPAAPAPTLTLRDPDQVVAEAARAMATLRTVLDQVPPLVIEGKRYLRANEFALVGAFFNVTATIVETAAIREDGRVRGYEAIAHAVDRWSQHVFARAEAECTRDEPRWAGRPRAQLRAMAQTRAARKVLALTFGWAVALGGFADRPAEDVEEERPARPDVISDTERRQLWAVARDHGWGLDAVAALVERESGQADTGTLPRVVYERLLTELRQGPPARAASGE